MGTAMTCLLKYGTRQPSAHRRVEVLVVAGARGKVIQPQLFQPKAPKFLYLRILPVWCCLNYPDLSNPVLCSLGPSRAIIIVWCIELPRVIHLFGLPLPAVHAQVG